MVDDPATGRDATDPDIDSERLVRVLEEHPVRFAVCFGSAVRNERTDRSDIDIAVEFEGELTPDERLDARLSLLGALMGALGTDDVDLADFDTIRPRVGLAALRDGIVLVGSDARRDRLHARFEREAECLSHEERLDRFDRVLTDLEELV